MEERIDSVIDKEALQKEFEWLKAQLNDIPEVVLRSRREKYVLIGITVINVICAAISLFK